MTYFPNARRKTKLGRPASYPWDEWTDGQERILREGDDFKCMAESFVILARRTAKVRGLHVVASTTAVPTGAPPLNVGTRDEPVLLQPGGTYVTIRFVQEAA